jgi:hypothetical protein
VPEAGKKPRRVIAKVEWPPGELYQSIGFIVTNMTRSAEKCRRLLQQKRGTCEQWITEGKCAMKLKMNRVGSERPARKPRTFAASREHIDVKRPIIIAAGKEGGPHVATDKFVGSSGAHSHPRDPDC